MYKPGISSKSRSLTLFECVSAFCTHRPSLLPIGQVSDLIGWRVNLLIYNIAVKICKLDYLEEGEVVTRFP